MDWLRDGGGDAVFPIDECVGQHGCYTHVETTCRYAKKLYYNHVQRKT